MFLPEPYRYELKAEAKTKGVYYCVWKSKIFSNISHEDYIISEIVFFFQNGMFIISDYNLLLIAMINGNFRS